MRIWSLVGSLAVLILPFAYIRYEFGNLATSITWAALLWVTVEGQVLGFRGEQTEFIQVGWFETNGVYHNYFGDLWFIGLLILILLIIAIILSITITGKSNKNIPAILLLGSSLGLLILRFLRLSELDTSFINQGEGFIEQSYIEIPIGFLLGLIFSILDIKAD